MLADISLAEKPGSKRPRHDHVRKRLERRYLGV
jgi:hypothetical protein